ncbi:hypothetical protein HDU98_011695 [Podochytrium sp. JEL0797]|nr:hypothetical protein HDU98_011695 [Podochytrium sp. JEL0797]
MDSMNTTSSRYYTYNSFEYAYNSSYCESSCSLCYLSFPFAIVGIIVGFAMIKRSKIILNGSVRPMIQVTARYAPPYAFAAPPYQQPSYPPPTSPYASRRLSLESLALQIQVPKLLDVRGGIDEVMVLDHQQLRDRYGITNEEYMRIKAYKKSIGQ